ncbi:MAG: recombinase family protein [Cyclobacteriaceae bacterium]
MKVGYARVSTLDQNYSLQLDALKEAGCEKIFKEKASGSKSTRKELDRMIDQLREGDELVIWKLDRLGRSLQHLVTVVRELMDRGVGLISLNDPIDTTTSQGRFVFNLFASLAEFERDIIRERTMAGLKAARARGRQGGRKPGLSESAEKTAIAAEVLYKEKTLSIDEICDKLKISKPTLYKYLRFRKVKIG